jgi:NADH kinase
LIVKKKSDAKTSKALRGVIEHIRHAHPHMNIVVESESRQEIPEEYNVRFFDPQDRQYLASKIDLVVTLGGDGTILHVSSLFERSDVPPILSFSMGTLGFLMPFHINTFATAFKEVVQSRATLLLRMRLCQTTHNADGSLLARSDGESSEIHLMNEVALHRASSPHMTTMDAFVDGRHLTQSISDGLIIATPTGSTAYSLSAGGPIVHPSVQSILLTPICPRSLSFRPVLLPSDAHVQLRVSEKSRAAAQVSVDGREVQALEPGQYLQVAMSPYPIPCVNRTSPHMSTRTGQLSSTEGGIASSLPPSDRGEDDWAGDINTLLRFNASFSGRGLLGGNGSYEDID